MQACFASIAVLLTVWSGHSSGRTGSKLVPLLGKVTVSENGTNEIDIFLPDLGHTVTATILEGAKLNTKPIQEASPKRKLTCSVTKSGTVWVRIDPVKGNAASLPKDRDWSMKLHLPPDFKAGAFRSDRDTLCWFYGGGRPGSGEGPPALLDVEHLEATESRTFTVWLVPLEDNPGVVPNPYLRRQPYDGIP